MSNSPLICYTKISPNRTSPRKNTIKKITIHHMAGNLSVETCGNVFAPNSRQASSNYGIGTDGRIGMYVEEKDRAWTSSSPDNDNQAVTIEVANDKLGPTWTISDKAMQSLINLCTDICKRNGISKLNFTGDKSGNLTMHCWFAATGCPGPYLKSKFSYIANEVNKRLGAGGSTTTTPSTPSASNPTTTSKISVGDVVKITTGATYYSGKTIPSWVVNTEWIVSSVSGDRVVINKSKDGSRSINSPVNAKYLTVVNSSKVPYLISVNTDELNIRKGPSADYPKVGVIKRGEVYTIIEESNGWGRLKSGVGWIALNYTKKK